MKTTLDEATFNGLLSRLRDVQEAFVARYPGELAQRQPVHTVYGGAHLFKADTARKLGELALGSLALHAPEPDALAEAIGIDPAIAAPVYARVTEKLKREPVEDFRIDFEDGYGNRPDDEEDRHAEVAALEVAKGMAGGTLPPFLGIRIKPLSGDLGARSIRTLDLFLSALVAKTGGNLPGNFVVTLPKITSPDHVAVLVEVFQSLEKSFGLPALSLRMEFMIETPQVILDPSGQSMLPSILTAARGRCVSAHFGTYDYTAGCSITASLQRMRHPACDFAKHMMQVAYASTGIWLSDGATNIMPVAPYRAAEGKPLSEEQVRENQRVVYAAWRMHADDIRHSLQNGYYQGWDLHPAQLPTRYATVYAFFLQGYKAASQRLENFISKAAQATLVGDVFDDAATGQGLLNFFLRGVNCGALTEDEALKTGITLEELRGRSFLKILKNRRKMT
ncbi:MAG: phosphoenolpyruvate kinase [Deltaproteobacteria bacterium]|nr:phosphoenolpyruvate kinase [Deltaproteobacteria bacterium]